MMRGMTRRSNVFCLVPTLFLLSSPGPIKADSLALQSTPEISVFVYGFPGLSSWVVEGAETEAERLLRPARIRLKWVNCTSEGAPPACHAPQSPSELVVLFRPNALPLVSPAALGLALISPGGATAFIFYGRILALETSTSITPVMFGRVLAHEVVHLLLPGEMHSDGGLMRGHWAPDDLRFTSTACLGLTARSIQLIQEEARRRAVAGSRTSGGR